MNTAQTIPSKLLHDQIILQKCLIIAIKICITKNSNWQNSNFLQIWHQAQAQMIQNVGSAINLKTDIQDLFVIIQKCSCKAHNTCLGIDLLWATS